MKYLRECTKRHKRDNEKKRYHSDPIYREIIKQRTKDYTKRKYKGTSQKVHHAKNGRIASYLYTTLHKM